MESKKFLLAVLSMIITFIIIICTFTINVISMIYGWGIQPKSWLIIICAFISQTFLFTLNSTISYLIKNEKN